jgi:endogenous inhibitor of DNA gyrase (YacG/DUF329 family)
MPRKKTKSLRCPTCRKLLLMSDPEFPFCSERCRMIDLGKWASGAYVISAPVNDPESGGEAEYHEPPSRRIGGSKNDEDAGGDEFHGGRKPN